jgi:hypothetical protein
MCNKNRVYDYFLEAQTQCRALTASSSEQDQANAKMHALILQFWRQIHVYLSENMNDHDIMAHAEFMLSEMNEEWERYVSRLREKVSIKDRQKNPVFLKKPATFVPSETAMLDYIISVIQPRIESQDGL